MKALLCAHESTESDDDGSDGEEEDGYRPQPVMRVRCYCCRGSGKLELVEEDGAQKGRMVRCIACAGTGKVAVK